MACLLDNPLCWEAKCFIATMLLTAGVIGATRLYFTAFLTSEYTQDQALVKMHTMSDPLPVKIHKPPLPDPPVHDPDRSRLDEIRERGFIRVGYLEDALSHAKIKVLKSPREFFKGKEMNLDAFVHTAEAGSAWTLLYPEFSVAIPSRNILTVPMAYPIARGDRDFLDYMSVWIDLKKKDGTSDRLYEYWILGKGAVVKEPRWSVIRNVLGWVD